MRTLIRSAAAVAIVAAILFPLRGAAGDEASDAAPDSFDVVAVAAPVKVHVSASSVLPLDVDASLVYSAVALNSQPNVRADAGPGYVPLADSIGLLGGIGAVPQIGVRLLPGLIVGLPTIFGLDPLPVPPPTLPDVPILPSPSTPGLSCSAYYPGDPRLISCGGPSDSPVGFTISAASGTAKTVDGDAAKEKLRGDASAAAAGIAPTAGATLLPISIGAVSSAATSSVVDGRITAGSSASVGDINIAGAIKIPAIRSAVRAASAGTKRSASVLTEPCTITGATVAGVPVTIDATGVHAATTSVPLPVGDVDVLVQRTLATLGVSLRSVSGRADPGSVGAPIAPRTLNVSDDGTKLSGSQSCLELTYTIPTSGTSVVIDFANAAFTMSAFAPVPFEPDPTGGSTEAAPPPADPGTSSGPASSPSSVDAGSNPASSPDLAPSPPPPPAPQPGANAGKPSATPFVRAGAIRSWQVPYSPLAVLLLAFPLAFSTRRIALRAPGSAKRGDVR